MKNVLRQIVASLCLVALICGGQASACVCDVAPATAECGSHEHGEHDGQNSDQHDHSSPGDGAQCPCATCHSCTHMPVALPAIQLPALQAASSISQSAENPRLLARSCEIFIPPKLA